MAWCGGGEGQDHPLPKRNDPLMLCFFLSLPNHPAEKRLNLTLSMSHRDADNLYTIYVTKQLYQMKNPISLTLADSFIQ